MGVGAGATHFTFLTFLWRVLSALLGGVLIGAERQWRLRTAGLRTHALVTVGASLFMMVAPTVSTPDQYAHLAGQIITGIGFLGAGVLMRTGLTVHGLNTATTIWCSAAVGVLTGAGAYAEAYVGTFFVLVINIALVPLSNWFTQHSRATPHEHDVGYVLKVACRNRQETVIRTLLIQLITASPLALHQLESTVGHDDLVTVIKAHLTTPERNDAQIEQVASRLSLERDVTGLSWELTDAGKAEQGSGH